MHNNEEVQNLSAQLAERFRDHLIVIMFTFLFILCTCLPLLCIAWGICCCLLANKVVYKHVSMTSLFPLPKPTYPQSFMLIHGFLLELWVSNLNEEEEEEKKKKMKNSAHHSPIHL